jgi:3-hydroxybutyryl-CoA dehydrogenase
MDIFALEAEFSRHSFICETLADSMFRPGDLLRQMVERSELGAKTGKGFYDYARKDVDAMRRERGKRFTELLCFLKILRKTGRR